MTPNDVKIVAENIDDFIEVPDGVERLRKAVLTLAVSGKLVPQDKEEGTGEELYSQILSEIKESGQKKNNQKTHHTIPLELPFAIPKSWWKAELGKITYQITDGTHFTPAYIEKGVPFVSIKDVSRGRLDFSNTKYISEKEHNDLIKRCNPQFDDILFCRIGTLGRAALVDTRKPFSIFVSLGLIKYPTSRILPNYLLTVLNSPCLYAQYDQIKAGGSHTNKLNLKEMPRLIIPLPPFAEQKRIVNKVEEVMKQLDELEAKKQERDKVRELLARSSMQALGKGDSKVAFEHLAELIKTPADLKELEGALLTLAVSGQLVPQNKNEGLAAELYAEIQKRRVSNAENRRKKIKDFIPITDEVIPFEIPRSWKWTRMSELVDLITDGEHISPEKHTEGIPLVTAKNVVEAGVTFQNVDYVTKENAKKFWARCHPEKGDLLICSRGTIGRTTIVDIDSPFCLMGSVILIKFFDSTISDYCKYYLRTQSGVSQIGLMRKGMAVGALYLKDIEKALIPLPPLLEQKRIIKKVEEMMILISKLRGHLSA